MNDANCNELFEAVQKALAEHGHNACMLYVPEDGNARLVSATGNSPVASSPEEDLPLAVDTNAARDLSADVLYRLERFTAGSHTSGGCC